VIQLRGDRRPAQRAARKVEQIIRVSQRPLSLEMPVGEEEDSYLGDFIEDAEADSPTDSASQTLLRQVIDEIFESLTPREVRILQVALWPGGRLLVHFRRGRQEVRRHPRAHPARSKREALGRLRHPPAAAARYCATI